VGWGVGGGGRAGRSPAGPRYFPMTPSKMEKARGGPCAEKNPGASRKGWPLPPDNKRSALPKVKNKKKRKNANSKQPVPLSEGRRSASHPCAGKGFTVKPLKGSSPFHGGGDFSGEKKKRSV